MDIRVESAIIWAALCVLVGLILLGGCVLCYLALSECHSWICSDGIETRNRKDIESYISPLQLPHHQSGSVQARNELSFPTSQTIAAQPRRHSKQCRPPTASVPAITLHLSQHEHEVDATTTRTVTRSGQKLRRSPLTCNPQQRVQTSPDIDRLANSVNDLSVVARDARQTCKPTSVLTRASPSKQSVGKTSRPNLKPAPVPKATKSPTFPRHFKRKKERNVAISQNALKNHICSGRILDAAMAQTISMKRARNIYKNTVFQAPGGWDRWETSRGDRIVSTERVSTYQCKRRGTSNQWNVEFMGEKLAIFRTDWPHPNAHHLLAGETLQS